MSNTETLARTLVGVVVSNKMEKTISVLVERRVMHPIYRKYIRKSTKILAHDDANTCNIGDTVQIRETRPLSKNKSWVLEKVIERVA